MSANAYQILFSIPAIKSALLMGPEGGGQLKIEFSQKKAAPQSWRCLTRQPRGAAVCLRRRLSGGTRDKVDGY